MNIIFFFTIIVLQISPLTSFSSHLANLIFPYLHKHYIKKYSQNLNQLRCIHKDIIMPKIASLDGLNFPEKSKFQDSFYPNTQDMVYEWTQPPKRVLLMSKPEVDILNYLFNAVQILWEKQITIYFEANSLEFLKTFQPFHNWFLKLNNVERQRIQDFKKDESDIDLVLTFGGDGLLLHCNTLFKKAVPPIMCFDFGSFGFLTPFQFDDFKKEIDTVLLGKALITLRTRLECTLIFSNSTKVKYNVLNEAVVDRGSSPFLTILDIKCNSHYLTTLQGDGMIFSTPTGSTAYSLSAGGSIVYPSVPAILLTPICAHTLSFRPVILPASAILECEVPMDCRSSAWVSLDGKQRQELQKGEKILIETSAYPLPTINRRNFTQDWFDSLRAGFMFNLRPRQRSFN